MSLQIIDIADAEINYLSANTHLFEKNKKLNYLMVGISVNGFSKSIALKGDKLERVLSLIKEVLVEDE